MSGLSHLSGPNLRVHTEFLNRERAAAASATEPAALHSTLSELQHARASAANAHYGDYAALRHILPAMERLRGEGYSSSSDPMLNVSMHRSRSTTSLGRPLTPSDVGFATLKHVYRAPTTPDAHRDGSVRRRWDVDHHHFHATKTGPAHWAHHPQAEAAHEFHEPAPYGVPVHRLSKPAVVRPSSVSSRLFGETSARAAEARWGAPLVPRTGAFIPQYPSPRPRRLGMHSMQARF